MVTVSHHSNQSSHLTETKYIHNGLFPLPIDAICEQEGPEGPNLLT